MDKMNDTDLITITMSYGAFKRQENELKELEELITLYKEWLGQRKSDFEFFTLFNNIVCKYDLTKEVIKELMEK